MKERFGKGIVKDFYEKIDTLLIFRVHLLYFEKELNREKCYYLNKLFALKLYYDFFFVSFID